MKTFDRYLQRKYHNKIPSLFEAVYKKDAVTVRHILFTILEELIGKYPIKPTNNNTEADKDLHMLEMITINFDIVYEDWLGIKDKSFVPRKPAIDNDYYIADLLQSEDYTSLNSLYFETMNYIWWKKKTNHTQAELISTLEEYKNKLNKTKG
jgi:hypothetical protein